MLAPQAPAEPRRQPVGQPVAVAELRPLWVTKGGVIEEAPVQRHEPTSRCGPGIEGREERKLVELGLELELELRGRPGTAGPIDQQYEVTDPLYHLAELVEVEGQVEESPLRVGDDGLEDY